jgi:hypothetical protein
MLDQVKISVKVDVFADSKSLRSRLDKPVKCSFRILLYIFLSKSESILLKWIRLKLGIKKRDMRELTLERQYSTKFGTIVSGAMKFAVSASIHSAFNFFSVKKYGWEII